MLNKIDSIVFSMTDIEIRNTVNSIEKKLQVSADNRPAGSLKGILIKYLMENVNNEQLVALSMSRRFICQHSEHNNFLVYPDQDRIEKTKEKMLAINARYQFDGELVMEDNPLVDALTAMIETVKADIRLLDSSCDICHSQDIGMTVAICNLCKKVNSPRAHKFGQPNGILPGYQPPELQGLTKAEVAAISCILPVIRIVRQGQGLCSVGHSISFPKDTSEIASQLPRLPRDLNIVHIRAPGPASNILHDQRDKIIGVFNWLKINNPSYADVQLSHEAMQ